MNNNTSNRKLAAIMFADIVSYSRLMGSNEAEALKLLKDFENLSIPIVEQSDGIIVKKNGDQIFCEFTSAKNAVDASISIQSNLHKYNDTRPKDFRLEVRIGIHIGDVTVDDGDIFGDGVNVAARIQPLASPGGICISGAVSDAISSHPEYEIVSKGKQELKNIIKKHSVFEVKTGYESIFEDSLNNSKSFIAQSFSSSWKGFLVVVLLLIFIGYSIYTFKSPGESIHVEVSPNKKGVVFIGDVISDSIYMDDFKWFLVFDEDLDSSLIEFEILPDSLTNFIYDELYNYITLNKQGIETIDIIGKDGLNKFYNKSKNSLAPDYSMEMLSTWRALFDPTRELEEVDTTIIHEDDILEDLRAQGGVFPLIYKLKKPIKGKGYAGSISYLFDFDSHIDSMHYTSSGETFFFNYNELEEKVYQEIINTIDEEVNPQLSKETLIYITQVKNDNVLFKFSNPTILLKKGVLLSAQRQYLKGGGRTTPDSSILNSLDQRLEDLYYIKNVIDKTPGSHEYNLFYGTSNLEFNNSRGGSINEIKQILNGTHLLSPDKEKDSLNMTISTNRTLGIKLKVLEVFDSTGSAVIFKVDRNKSPIESFTKLRAGDMLIFD